jgi:hypothetical protein
MRGKERTVLCAFTVLIVSALAWLQLRDFLLSVVAVPTFALIGFIAARAPFLVYLYHERKGYRPDLNLWRSGLPVMLAGGAVYCLSTGGLWAAGWLSLELNALYGGSKIGCASGGCCCATRTMAKSAMSLPLVEAVVSLVIVVCVSIFFVFERPEIGSAFGICAHISLRTFSYWMRGRNFIAAISSRCAEIGSAIFFLGALTSVIFSI